MTTDPAVQEASPTLFEQEVERLKRAHQRETRYLESAAGHIAELERIVSALRGVGIECSPAVSVHDSFPCSLWVQLYARTKDCLMVTAALDHLREMGYSVTDPDLEQLRIADCAITDRLHIVISTDDHYDAEPRKQEAA